MVDMLNCFSDYISEESQQAELLQMNFSNILIECLSAKDPIIKKTAIDFIFANREYVDIETIDTCMGPRALDWYR